MASFKHDYSSLFLHMGIDRLYFVIQLAIVFDGSCIFCSDRFIDEPKLFADARLWASESFSL